MDISTKMVGISASHLSRPHATTDGCFDVAVRNCSLSFSLRNVRERRTVTYGMARIFRRGELKQALLVIAASLERAHGYAIMSELEGRIGDGWKASPGAIYPALLALVEEGHLVVGDEGELRVYEITTAGRLAAAEAITAFAEAGEARWRSLAARSKNADTALTVGTLLDRFAAESQIRRRVVGSQMQGAVESVLDGAKREIARLLDADTTRPESRSGHEGEGHG